MYCPQKQERQWNSGDSEIDVYFPINEEERRCSRTFEAGRANESEDELYRLSFFDPIEVFLYKHRSKYKINDWLKWTFRMPVLGNMRDRYIENYAFGETLSFTTQIIGAGILANFQQVVFSAEINSHYLYQRYNGYSKKDGTEQQPVRNKIFGFSNPGLDYSVGAESNLKYLSTSLYWASYRYFLDRAHYDNEIHFKTVIYAYQSKSWWIGFRLERYERQHNMRKDQREDLRYRTDRVGVEFGF